jgi:signal transduction histidine kinase
MTARHWPLRWRLGFVIGVVMAATLGSIVVVAGAVAEQALIDSTAERLEIGAGLIAERPRAGPPVTALGASDVARLLGGQGTAVTILDDRGRVLASADNGAPPALAETRLSTAEYEEVIDLGQTRRAVISTTDGRALVVVAPVVLTGPRSGRGESAPGGPPGVRGGGPPFVPPGLAGRGEDGAGDDDGTDDDGVTAGALGPNALAQLVVSLAPIEATVSGLRVRLVGLGLGVLCVGILAALLVTRRAVRPLDRIAEAAGHLARGDLSARTGLTGADEIGSVGGAFDAMATRLERSFRSQRAFAADASHELRTPLAVLGGYADLLQRPDLPEADRERLVRSLRREVDRLDRLAGDLLLLTQLGAGAPVLRPVEMDLADVAREVGEAGAMLHSDVPIRTDASASLRIVADRGRIHQVLLNLVENAMRHAIPGTEVVVHAFADGDDAAVEVSNQGTPIPAEELPRLFERFARGTAEPETERRSAGPESAGHAGLGLSIARGIIEASGGSIGATSDDEATRFTIRLPLSQHRDSQPLLSEDGVPAA